MIALRALPGAPLYDGNDQRVIDIAMKDLEIYKKTGVDSITLENDHDVPYIQPPLPQEAYALYTKVAREVRKNFDGPIGIQVMEFGHEAALKIAKETDLDFIRVEAFVFAHVGGAGILEGCAGKLLRLRKELKAENIKVFTDVKKKHCSHSLTIDLEIEDEVKQAQMFLSDGIIITGKFTGEKPEQNDFLRVKKVTKLPLIVGSGMTPDNITSFLPIADGFIVGSIFRTNGDFFGDTEPDRVYKFVETFKKERSKIV